MLKKLLENQSIVRYGTSAMWLLLDKVIRLTAGLMVGVWVARYLGPTQFGILSYVMAFVGLFTPLGKLGFDGIVSRDTVRNEVNISQLLTSSAVLKFFGALLLTVITTSYMVLTKNDEIYAYLAIILSAVFVVKSLEVIEFYYRARVSSQSIAIANITGFLVASAFKVVIILADSDLIYFALANLLDSIIAITIITILFSKEKVSISVKNFSVNTSHTLIKESWPLMLGGFFALVYLNVDQIMIEEILGSYDVGQYSAAVRLSGAWYFIPMTIAWAVQAAIVNAKKKGKDVYDERIQQLLTFMAICAYCVILPVTLFADDIVKLLYGQEYSKAGKILSLHIWASLFVFVGSVRGLWVTNESHFKFDLISNFGAGILNVALNYFWIPLFGIEGAAWATLISYGFTYLVSGFIFKPSFHVAVMQIKSILLIDATERAILVIRQKNSN